MYGETPFYSRFANGALAIAAPGCYTALCQYI
jgi:hypothetical protein